MEPRLAQAGTGIMGLPWAELSTHLSFPEIAAEMFLSRTTIKSEALSIYRKYSNCPLRWTRWPLASRQATSSSRRSGGC